MSRRLCGLGDGDRRVPIRHGGRREASCDEGDAGEDEPRLNQTMPAMMMTTITIDYYNGRSFALIHDDMDRLGF